MQRVSFRDFIVEQGQLRLEVTQAEELEGAAEVEGFTNFYRRFIRDFVKVVTSLTQLAAPEVLFQWSPSAQ